MVGGRGGIRRASDSVLGGSRSLLPRARGPGVRAWNPRCCRGARACCRHSAATARSNYLMLASQAVSHAPQGADRAAVGPRSVAESDGLPCTSSCIRCCRALNIHESKDDRSYEYCVFIAAGTGPMETCAGTLPGQRWWRDLEMCRNIKTLANFAPPATDDEIRASALQFVRKLSGTIEAIARQRGRIQSSCR